MAENVSDEQTRGQRGAGTWPDVRCRSSDGVVDDDDVDSGKGDGENLTWVSRVLSAC